METRPKNLSDTTAQRNDATLYLENRTPDITMTMAPGIHHLITLCVCQQCDNRQAEDSQLLQELQLSFVSIAGIAYCHPSVHLPLVYLGLLSICSWGHLNLGPSLSSPAPMLLQLASAAQINPEAQYNSVVPWAP